MVAAAVALVLALLGAFGLGPGWGRGAGETLVLIDQSPSCGDPLRPPPGARAFADSDLQRALRAAAEDGASRIVLYSDGCDTTGAAPQFSDVPVDFVLLSRADNIALESLEIPPAVGVDVAFSVRVRVARTAASTGEAAALRVRLFRDGEPVGAPRSLRLERGLRRSVTFVDRVGSPGIATYVARVEGGPGPSDDDSLEARVRVGDRPQVVVLGAPPAWLDRKKFTPTLWRSDLPLADFDAALLTGPLPVGPAAARLAQAVRGGLGLFVVGDPAADDSALAELLPLTATPPAGRAVVLLLDLSGSMELHLDALRQAYFDLCARLAPTDRVALVRFRDRVLDASAWTDARDAGKLWKASVARGNTTLSPAIEKALAMLADVSARHRRLYVVSDGEWHDKANTDLRERIEAATGIHRAALFVENETPADARALFPVHAESGGSITAALLKLEAQAPGRWVRAQVVASAHEPPAWLRGAVPGQRAFGDFPRLYARGVGEAIVLRAREIPLLAAREEGGRIVQAAPAQVATAALLAACVRPAVGVLLAATREGRDVHLVARGSAGAPWQVGDRVVPALASGPDEWEARLERAPLDTFEVRCAGALLHVAAARAAELAGQHSDAAYGTSLARASGGRFFRDVLPADADAGEGPARATASLTLLAAAVLVLGAAFLRRGT